MGASGLKGMLSSRKMSLESSRSFIRNNRYGLRLKCKPVLYILGNYLQIACLLRCFSKGREMIMLDGEQ